MKTIKVYKEKQYLVFDFENGKEVRYDFATKVPIGIKGKPVTGLHSQLSGISIEQVFNSCSDEKYAKFLKFVRDTESSGRYSYSITNLGTILSRVPRYANYEQLFSAGIDEIVGKNFKYTINDIPKGLIKLCKERKIKLSNNFLDYYKVNPDAHLLAYNLEYMSLTDNNIYEILAYENHDYNHETREYDYWSYYNKLINEYGYTAKALLLYLDYLKTYEALDDVDGTLREVYDYAKMMKLISNKFDKYPRNFLTSHRIACRNYNRLKQEFSESIFKKRTDKSLEYSYGDYKFIYPNTTQEIKDEAVQQNNCVASYIQKVIDGNCHILFMRRKDNIENSLVTIEVRNNIIVQAKGKFNRDTTSDEQEAINKWNEYIKNKLNKKEKEKVAC